MNYSVDANVIAQALRNGISQEDIANTFAAALNQASAAIKQERALQKQKEANKMKAAQAAADFYNTYYPELFPSNEKATAESIIKACDSVKKIADSATELATKIDPKNIAHLDFSRIFGL